MTNLELWNNVAIATTSLLAALLIYVWTSIALGGVFRKSGEQAWKGWVPILNAVVLLRLGGLSGWLVLLFIIPIFGWVALLVAVHRINHAFGYTGGMTVLAYFLFPVWASIVGFGPERWVGREVAGAHGPVRSTHAPAPAGGASEPPPAVAAYAPMAPPPAYGRAPAPMAPPAAYDRRAAPTTPPPPAAAGWTPPPMTPQPVAPVPAPDSSAGSAARPSAPVDSVPHAPVSAPSPATPAPPVTSEVPAAMPPAPASPAAATPTAASPAPASAFNAAAPESEEYTPPIRRSYTPPEPLDDDLSSDADDWFFDVAQGSATSEVTAAVPGAPAPVSAAPTRARVGDDVPQTDSAIAPVSHVPAASDPVVVREPWAPTHPPVPGEDDAFPETSGPVSAIAGAPDAGGPRSALSSVSALHARPHIPEDDDDFDQTIVARRKRTAWVLVGPTRTHVPLTSETVILGRRPVRDPEFPDAQLISLDDDTRTMSKTHARLELRDERWFITDLDSTNGVLFATVMGTEVAATPGEATEAGDRFLLGDAEVSLIRGDE